MAFEAGTWVQLGTTQVRWDDVVALTSGRSGNRHLIVRLRDGSEVVTDCTELPKTVVDRMIEYARDIRRQ